MCHAFHFGQLVGDKLLHTVAVGHLIGTNCINPLTVGVLTRDGVLLHHIAERDDDKGQGDAQTDELDGGVKLVAG